MVADNEMVDRGFCLADVGNAYMVYLPEGGDVSLDLAAQHDSPAGSLAAEWLDTHTGQKVSSEVDECKFDTRLVNPLELASNPCVVVVRVRR
jgi:hypothetical protein